MNKERELVKNTVIIALGKICTQLVSFLLLPLYTAILTTEEYGIIDLILTYTTLLLPFVTLALEQALFRFLIDARGDVAKCGKYITTTIIISILFTSIICCMAILISFILKNTILVYFGLVLLSGIISSISLQISRGLGDNLGYTLSSSGAAICQVVCNVLFLVIFRLGVSGMMAATIIGNFFVGIITYHRCKLKQYIKIKYFCNDCLKELYRYSVPLIPNQLSWWALNASNKVIVNLFIGVSANGLIAVSNKFSGIYIQFSNIFNVSWTESVALHIHDSDAEQFISKTINMVYRLFLCGCCGMISCMPFVFPVMVNVQYNDAYGLIPIFMLASLFNVIVSLYGVIYVAHKKTSEIARTAIYAAVLNILSHLILINCLGIYAAAVSTMIGYGSMAIYRYFHSRRYLVIKFSNSTLLVSLLMIGLSFFSYYSGNMIVQIIVLFIMIVLSIKLNLSILKQIMKTTSIRFRRE